MKPKQPSRRYRKLFNFKWESEQEAQTFKAHAVRRHMPLSILIRQLIYQDIEAFKKER